MGYNEADVVRLLEQILWHSGTESSKCHIIKLNKLINMRDERLMRRKA